MEFVRRDSNEDLSKYIIVLKTAVIKFLARCIDIDWVLCSNVAL